MVTRMVMSPASIFCTVRGLRERLEAASARRTVPPAQVVLDLIKTLPDQPAENTAELSACDLMKDDLGCVDSGLGDLFTNPKYLEGYWW